jgi:hypothetical protein
VRSFFVTLSIPNHKFTCNQNCQIMKNGMRILQLLFLLFFQFSLAQIELETVYVVGKKLVKAPIEVRYYYFPNLEAYFDTCNAVYIYKKDGEWVTSELLSDSYRGYSLYNKSFVILEGFTEDNPYTNIQEHKKKYPANFSSKRRKDAAVAHY